MIQIQQLRNKLEQDKGKLLSLKEQFRKKVSEEKELKSSIDFIEKAKAILQQVATDTQNELVFHISNIVNTALTSIFEDPYNFIFQFIQKRGKTEAEFLLERDKNEIDIMNAAGGGVVDIVSFALRIALYSINTPKTRNTIILDEPFRFISKDLKPKAGELLRLLSEKLELQFIVVSHDTEIIENANKTFYVKKICGESVVS